MFYIKIESNYDHGFDQKWNFHQQTQFHFKFLCIQQSTQAGNVPEYCAEEGIMIWYDDIWYDVMWYMIWYDMLYDMVWYMIWYGMMWYDIW